jgi:hypothetical protein
MSIKDAKSIETLQDMKRFVEEYPEFRKLGGNVAKHVSLVGELSKVVERDGLLSISEVEQSLASSESHAADLKVSRSTVTARNRAERSFTSRTCCLSLRTDGLRQTTSCDWPYCTLFDIKECRATLFRAS